MYISMNIMIGTNWIILQWKFFVCRTCQSRVCLCKDHLFNPGRQCWFLPPKAEVILLSWLQWVSFRFVACLSSPCCCKSKAKRKRYDCKKVPIYNERLFLFNFTLQMTSTHCRWMRHEVPRRHRSTVFQLSCGSISSLHYQKVLMIMLGDIQCQQTLRSVYSSYNSLFWWFFLSEMLIMSAECWMSAPGARARGGWSKLKVIH